MAIGSAALHLERRRHREVMLYSYHSLPLQYKGIMVLIPMLGLIIWSGCWTMRHFMAEAYCNTVHNSTLNREQNPALREITKAIEWDRWNGEYYFKMARELAKIRDSEVLNPDWNMEERRKRQLEIITALEQAVRLNPFNAKYHLTLGWEYTYLWKDRDGYSKWLPAADLSVERAAYWAGVKTPYLHVKIGDYWTMRSKTVYPTNPMHKIFWASACRHYRKARSLEKSEALTDKIVKYVWSFYPDQEKIRDLGIRDRGLGIGG